MQRLDDAEFGRRQRERNLRANRQRRERLALAGYAQWNLWIHGEIRALAERLADERAQSPSELVAELIKSAALTTNPITTTTAPAITTPEPATDFSREARLARKARLVEVCGDSVRSGASSRDLVALATQAGLFSEAGTPMLAESIRQAVRLADRNAVDHGGAG